MTWKQKTDNTNFEKSSWRDYQTVLKRISTQKRLTSGTVKFAFWALLVCVVAYGAITSLGGQSFSHLATDRISSFQYTPQYTPSFNKNKVQALLNNVSFINIEEKSFDFGSNGQKFRVDTSLDIELQHYLLSKLNTSTARYIGIVAMDPATGRILSMVSFDKTNPSNNPCLDNRFPAASIFKIITASAVIEKYGFGPNHIFTFNGMKHTLYRSQLKDRKTRYTNRITFKDAFAQSVNPVFGKIGALYLGKEALEKYAKAFGFDRKINFELRLEPSCVAVTDKPYSWAEIASGFNNNTKMSPIHGAMIVSAIINQGKLPEPTIVDRIVNEKGRVIYQNQSVSITRAISAYASATLSRLMATTVKSGTLRKTFRRYKRDKVLSRLNIGGKTGSIDNKTHDVRFDWFVGFAESKGGERKIALSVIVAHEKYIGLRAGYYARIAMRSYFDSYFAQKNNHQTKRLVASKTKVQTAGDKM
jgi:peptidoglycan glycosyltransferase